MAGKTKKRKIEESGSRLNMKRAAQIRSTYVNRKKEREIKQLALLEFR